MIHASLFSGIGGFDLAAEWMNWQNVFHCEWNPFCQKVLKHHFPNSIPYHDITKTDFTIHRGSIDVLTGGFPCQPYSQAGKRLGKEDERHLWPEMLRAVREIQPSWVVGENVRGLVNWDGGLVFDEVQADLEAEGYEVWPFLLPAAGVDAPHERYRIWFVALNAKFTTYGRYKSEESTGNGVDLERNELVSTRWDESTDKPYSSGYNGLNTDTDDIGHAGSGETWRGQSGSSNLCCDDATYPNGIRLRGQSNGTGVAGQLSKNGEANNWDNFPTQSPVCDGNDGVSAGLDGITFSKWRNESIKAGGNAIVPQVVYQIFKAINQYHAQP
jgi:DNA (cytosine-5)-methyltransferase 1